MHSSIQKYSGQFRYTIVAFVKRILQEEARPRSDLAQGGWSHQFSVTNLTCAPRYIRALFILDTHTTIFLVFILRIKSSNLFCINGCFSSLFFSGASSFVLFFFRIFESVNLYNFKSFFFYSRKQRLKKAKEIS